MDLVPELQKLQETCIENLFQIACMPPASSSKTITASIATTSTSNIFTNVNLNDVSTTNYNNNYNITEQTQKTGLTINSSKNFFKFHIDSGLLYKIINKIQF